MVKSIRDILEGPPHPSESITLRTVAAEQTEALIPYQDGDWMSYLPGDDGEHPLGQCGQNPYPGLSVQAVAKMLREGSIPADKERKARAFIDQFQKWSGQTIYAPLNHNPIFSTEQQYADEDTVQFGGLRRADRGSR